MKLCLDACVLYPTVLREILMGAASEGLFAPLWSARICEEWRRAAERLSPGDGAVAEGEIARLNFRWPEAQVPHDPALEARLWLPDPADIHVLATAIAGEAEGIVTLNLRDFPIRELAAYGLTPRHPDAFLHDLWLESPETVMRVVAGVHAEAERLAGQTLDLRRLMKRARLPRLGKALSSTWS